MIKGAIFDMDGTLFDSLSMWEKVDAKYLASIGVQVTDAISRQFFKRSLFESAQYIQEHFRHDLSADSISDGLLSVARDYYMNEVPLKKGVRTVLESFKNWQLPMTLATSNNRHIVDDVLKIHHLDHYFIDVLTVEEEGIGKSSPQIYEHACQLMHTKPSETLVFEDALHALKTAQQAHFITVGCYDDYSLADQSEIKSLCDYYVRSIDEILDVEDIRCKLELSR